MSNIQLTARFKIHPDKLERFKSLSQESIQIVNKKEKGHGTLQYDWFITADGSECVVHETFRDSDAILTHMQNLGPQLGSLMEISDFSAELCGDASPQLQEAVKGLDVVSYAYVGGMG
ncbi:MAG: hypothetical protein HKN87_02760 [Saprospiraceae bacterium]|nr:hypothetical protein [Saprospiraceae bacterium]